MYPRLGLRSRILALTMPIVILVSAATAGIIYLSLGQVVKLHTTSPELFAWCR